LTLKRDLYNLLNQPYETNNDIVGIFACGAQDYAGNLISNRAVWYTKTGEGFGLNSGVAAAGLSKLVFCLSEGKERPTTRHEVQAAMDTAAGPKPTTTIEYWWWR